MEGDLLLNCNETTELYHMFDISKEIFFASELI